MVCFMNLLVSNPSRRPEIISWSRHSLLFTVHPTGETKENEFSPLHGSPSAEYRLVYDHES